MKARSFFFLFSILFFSWAKARLWYDQRKPSRSCFLGNSIHLFRQYIAYYRNLLSSKTPESRHRRINLAAQARTVVGAFRKRVMPEAFKDQTADERLDGFGPNSAGFVFVNYDWRRDLSPIWFCAVKKWRRMNWWIPKVWKIGADEAIFRTSHRYMTH